MDAVIIGRAQDLRSMAPILYAQIDVGEYLTLVGEEFDEFDIQRSRQEHRIYDRMKDDVKKGALLPGITLALKPDVIKKVKPLVDAKDTEPNRAKLSKAVFQPGAVNILDGLQRTHILKDLATGGHEFIDGQRLLLEIWVESDLKNLIYRIIVLNAGQKPMTIRHQIELLFLNVRDIIKAEIPSLVLLRERDEANRRGARQFILGRVAAAYQAFVTRGPDIEKENVVAQELVTNAIATLSEDELHEEFHRFLKYLKRYSDLDAEFYRVYAPLKEEIPEGPNWLAVENVMLGFFAAVSDFSRSPDRAGRVDTAIEKLAKDLRAASPGTDLMGLKDYRKIVFGYSPRKANVGRATRQLIFTGFKEYFREEGQKSLAECWRAEAS
jgi:hypothetical protein